MAVTGNLGEVDVANVVELARQADAPVRLVLRNNGEEALLFVEGGDVVYARLGDRMGEEAVYEVLGWRTGTFEMEKGVEAPPERNVSLPWTALLLQGLQRIDESQEEEVIEMPAKERLEDVLEELANSLEPGLNGIAVVGIDGLGIQFHKISGEAADRLSSQVALLMQLAKRAVNQMGGGEVEDVQVTTKDGYFLGEFLGDGRYFLAVSVSRDAVLGNVRLMMRNFADRIYKAIPGVK